MRALITGSSGFVGSHLAEHLILAGADVFGLSRRASARGPLPPDRVFLGDIRDGAFLQRVLAQVVPTHLFHLAGVLGGAPGGDALQFDVNVIGTVRLFESLVARGQSPRLLVAGSSAVYGASRGQPLDEDSELRPLTAYAESKCAQEWVAQRYAREHGLSVIRARSFNLLGPRQPSSLVVSAIARQIVHIERGGPAPLRLGNLAPQRDFTDVRDAVRAYADLIALGQPGEVYNVCSGVARSVRECADGLVALARVPLSYHTDPALVRAVELCAQVGSAARLTQTTGWQPRLAFAQSLRDVLDDWRLNLTQTEITTPC